MYTFDFITGQWYCVVPDTRRVARHEPNRDGLAHPEDAMCQRQPPEPERAC